MNAERQFYNQPIRSLQTMLRTIALFSDEYERIIPDGIYGPETQNAISNFQRNRGLPESQIAAHGKKLFSSMTRRWKASPLPSLLILRRRMNFHIPGVIAAPG